MLDLVRENITFVQFVCFTAEQYIDFTQRKTDGKMGRQPQGIGNEHETVSL